jgi:hypothetical protein
MSEREPTDDRWIDLVRVEYAPDESSSARQAAFDRRLEEAISRPPSRWWLPVVATGAAAALLLLVPRSAPDPLEHAAASRSATASAWDYELFFPNDEVEWLVASEVDFLPSEYDAYARLLEE